jgi:hypothetical protein
MKFAFISFVTVTVLACSGEDRSIYPTAPSPPRTAVVSVVVIEERRNPTGECIQAATVEVVAGQGVGKRVRQADGCTIWDPDYSAYFSGLTPGVEMTLRASAEGYAPRELTIVPTLEPKPAVMIGLSRLP